MLKQLLTAAAAITLTVSVVSAEVVPLPASLFWGEPEQRQQLDQHVGKPAPQLNLTGWLNGEPTADDLKGKIVVLDFWATWCGPCIQSIPKNNRLSEKYRDQGVVILGICSSNRGQDRHQATVEKHGLKYPTATDPNSAAAEAYGVMWYPTYVIIDRNNTVRGVGLAGDKVEDAIKLILKEQPAK